MKQNIRQSSKLVFSSLAAIALCFNPLAQAQLNSGQPQLLSTNQTVTPLAPTGSTFQALNPHLKDNPGYTVGQAVSTVVSPDKKTLLILTTGYNLWEYTSGPLAGQTNPTDSTEWIFVFDISSNKPVQKQAIPVPNTYCGIAFNPSGTEFYVSGGDDDEVHIYDLAKGLWAETATPVKLNHNGIPATGGINSGGLGIETLPEAAGLAITADGKTIVVANYENDSISILRNSAGVWTKTGEYDLRPGEINPAQTGVPGGEFPFWVQIVGNNTAYVSSVRDREIDVVSIGGTPSLVTRIKVTGSPNKSVLSPLQDHLYVAEDNNDSVAVIDTRANTLLTEIKVTGPEAIPSDLKGLKGATPNSVTLSPDGHTLYVTNAGQNAVAVLKLANDNMSGEVVGLIPTGFYPNSVSLSANGKELYIVNGKSATGSNPGNRNNFYGSNNQYDLQLTKAGFQTLPLPTDGDLTWLTATVLQNNNFGKVLTPAQKAKMQALHSRIHHVIYIIKENRTYDQILGDLPVGDGDPAITQFGQAVTPNFHAIASNFVDFDNFYDASDVSGDGWPWSTSARTTDTIEKEIPTNYAGRGLDNNSEGLNRDLNIAIPTETEREAYVPILAAVGLGDPNILPGTANVAAPDSPEGEEGQGYLWNDALKAKLSVRDYGMFIDIVPYNLPVTLGGTPPLPDPYTAGVKVATSSNPVLAPLTDPYYRGFDNVFPDYFRFTEWNREFQQFNTNGNLPNLSLVRLMHDHTGNFSTAIAGVNTPELQEADNDYAVGLLIDAVAHSKYKSDTLIFVIEDDAQDGGDHVDAHRSTAYVVGPYVRHGYVDSYRYNTVSMLKTIEDVLGIPPLSLNDAHSLPMVDAFDLTQKDWTYSAVPSGYLASTTLPIPSSAYTTAALKPLHDASYWAAVTKGMDFSVEDHLDTPKYNRILWEGTMGDKPYPTTRSGKNLRENRAELLKAFNLQQQPAPDHAQETPTVETSNKPGR